MIFDILVLIFAFTSCIFGVYYAIRLRLQSKKTAMENKQNDLEILRIFEELEKKAVEINPGLMAQVREFNTNESLESYREYLYSSLDETALHTTSNHVSV
jgi:hypothetical protein